MLIHEREHRAVCKNVAASLDADSFEEPLVDTAYTLNLADGQIMHERDDRLAVEREVELAIRFILV